MVSRLLVRPVAPEVRALGAGVRIRVGVNTDDWCWNFHKYWQGSTAWMV